MKIGFIGFGSLGTAIVKNLLSKNYEIVGWNRTKEKLLSLPIEHVATPRQVIQNTDVVVLNLFDSVTVDEVLNGSNGLLSAEIKGKIIIDTTTNHFEKVIKFHSLVESKGGSYLEAPVLGSVVPASQGLLTILVSGEKEAYDRANSVLNSIGKAIYFLEEPGLATKMKLVNNLVLGSFMATIAEAVALGEVVGIKKEKVLDILSNGAGNSGILNAKREKLLKEDFAPHFSIAAIKKDIGYLSELADALSRPLMTGKILEGILDKAVQTGLSDLDFSSLYKVFKG